METDGTDLTPVELIRHVLSGYHKALNDEGVNEKLLARRRKQQLNAKKTQHVKLKGAVAKEDLPKGCRLIATSGVVLRVKGSDGETEAVCGDGDTLIEWREVDWDTRHKALVTTEKIFQIAGAEEVSHTGMVNIGVQLTPEQMQLGRQLAEYARQALKGGPAIEKPT